MKIGIEAQRIFRTGRHGMEVVAMELIKQLQELDRHNEYVIYAKDDKDRSCITESANFSVCKVRSFSYADWEQIALPLAIKKTKPDFVHCMANTAPLVCPAPLLLTLHDIIYLEQLDLKGSAYQNAGNLYRRWIAPRAIKKARLIVTVSEYEKRTIIQKCKLEESRVRVIYNGVDGRFNPLYKGGELYAFRQTYRLPAHFILFLGNTAPKKNAGNVIRAYTAYCDRNKDALPLVITDYDPRYVEKALAALNRSSLASQFILPGYVPAMEMPLMYNCASLFLYPSLRESFGLPILEAMACGTPVITANTSAMPEIAGGAALLVDPLSYTELASAISDILSDAGRLALYRRLGMERASQFSWKHAAIQLLDIYSAMQTKALT